MSVSVQAYQGWLHLQLIELSGFGILKMSVSLLSFVVITSAYLFLLLLVHRSSHQHDRDELVRFP